MTITDNSNASPFTKPNVPPHVPPSKGEDLRAAMAHWAIWAVAHRGSFTYTEGAARWHMVDSEPGSLPQSADCSAFVTGLAKWGGASDPNGLNYTGGFTGTLLKHCNRVTAAQARMGDLAVYGPGTGSHAVFVLERLPRNDFWVVSHGKPGDPSRVLHSELLRYFDGSVRFLRWVS